MIEELGLFVGLVFRVHVQEHARANDEAHHGRSLRLPPMRLKAFRMSRFGVTGWVLLAEGSKILYLSLFFEAF